MPYQIQVKLYKDVLVEHNPSTPQEPLEVVGYGRFLRYIESKQVCTPWMNITWSNQPTIPFATEDEALKFLAWVKEQTGWKGYEARVVPVGLTTQE